MSSSSSPSSSNNNNNKNDALNTPIRTPKKSKIDPDTPSSEKRVGFLDVDEELTYSIDDDNSMRPGSYSSNQSKKKNEVMDTHLVNSQTKMKEIENDYRKIGILIAFLKENEHIYTKNQVKSFKEGIDKATDVVRAKMKAYSEYLQEANLRYDGAISDLLIMSDESLPGATTDQNPSENIFETIPLNRSYSNDSNDSYNILGLKPGAPESPNTKKMMREVRKQYGKYLEDNKQENKQPKIVPSKAAKMKEEEERKKKKPKIGGKKTKSKKSKSKKNKTKKKNRKSKSKK